MCAHECNNWHYLSNSLQNIHKWGCYGNQTFMLVIETSWMVTSCNQLDFNSEWLALWRLNAFGATFIFGGQDISYNLQAIGVISGMIICKCHQIHQSNKYIQAYFYSIAHASVLPLISQEFCIKSWKKLKISGISLIPTCGTY